MTAERKRSVLLVEDDAMHAELVQRAFEDTPTIVVTVVRRIDEALAVLRQITPDVVITDFNLPDGRGTELIRDARYPVVLMTSQGSEAGAVEAMRAGALDYVVKSEAMFLEMPHVVTRALREWSQLQAHARTHRFLQAQYEVASALVSTQSVEEAGAGILEAVCKRVGWALGEFWGVEDDHGVLRREAVWAESTELDALGTTSARPRLGPGEGLPSETLRRGEPIRVRDVSDHGALGRLYVARHAALRGGFGFPVAIGTERVGVLTFFSLEVEPPDEELRLLLEAVSHQVAVLVLRQRAEAERMRLHAELVERERLAAIGETAACLGHEIANPLNGMYIAGQLLQRRLSRTEDADPKVVQGVAQIMADNRRLNGLLEDFRSLSRRQTIKRVPTDIGKIIDHVVNREAHLLEQSKVAVVVEIGGAIPVIEADDAKLTQVLLNLLKNAVEAMTPGGGTLTIDAHLSGANLIVAVADTGPGVPKDIDVFEPFKTTKAAGTGLGLPIARQILAAHGGTLDVVARPGPGAAFRLMLPVTAA